MQDARATYTEIGQSLGMAHSTVHERVKRMELNGIIKKYTTVIDTEKLGAKNITAITTVFTDPKTSEEVAQKLAQASQVLEVYTSLSEELLIIAKITAENQEQLHTFIANKVAPLPGVMRIRTSIVTRKYKETSPSLASQSKRLHL